MTRLFSHFLIVLAVITVGTLTFAAIAFPVTDGIYRGSRPYPEDLTTFKYLGIKTIVDVENNKKAIAKERREAKKIGLKFISIPLSGFFRPKDKNVNQILALLNDSSLYPIYLHCKYGEDRTGLLVGLYRVFTQNWNPADAYQEMLNLGFHPSLIFLNHYYEDRTGFED